MSSKITFEHLQKKLCIYIRQSSMHQVREHQEGRQVQYNLHERGRELGWAADQIITIDEDLGITATGTKIRSGFDHLLHMICQADLGGIIFTIASRLARNGEEWHRALGLCAHFNVLILDKDSVYDPNLANDCLLLGMQGSFSQYEVTQLQNLAHGALLNKAKRGELIRILPAGLIKTEDNRIEIDPDQRIQQAIHLVFNKFDEIGSIRQLCFWFQKKQIAIPIRDIENNNGIKWQVPTYENLQRILTRKMYAGAYQYPETKTITKWVDGRFVKTAGHPLGPDDEFFLHKHLFKSYISWEKYQQNQSIIANNANMKGKMVQGAAREGKSVFAGLIYCGHCSRKMSVRYYAPNNYPYYRCQGDKSIKIDRGCLNFSARYLEVAVVEQVKQTLQRKAIDATLLAEEKLAQTFKEKSDIIFHELQQVQYEAQRIERQFNAVDPENHLVSKTLSKRWEAALTKVKHVEQKYQQLLSEQKPLSDASKRQLYELAADFEKIWNHEKTDNKIKTRIVRLLVKQIWVKAVEQRKINVTIHWHGDTHTCMEFPRRYRKKSSNKNKEQHPNDLIEKLAAVCDDSQIVRILNRNKYQTDDKTNWTENQVFAYRQVKNIPQFSREQYNERGLVNLSQAAQILEISSASVLELIKHDLLKASQVIKYAPWEIKRTELEKSIVQKTVSAMKNGGPIKFNKDQLDLDL